MASSERSLVVKPAGAHVLALRKKSDLPSKEFRARPVPLFKIKIQFDSLKRSHYRGEFTARLPLELGGALGEADT